MIGHGFWGGPGWGIIGFLLMAAFWTLVVILVVSMIRGRGGPGRTPSGGAALRVLEDRYARGELSRDDFLERRAVLSGQRPEPGEPTKPTEPTG